MPERRLLEIAAFRALIESTVQGPGMFSDQRAAEVFLRRLEREGLAERPPGADRLRMFGVTGYAGGESARALLVNWSLAAGQVLAERQLQVAS